MDTKTAKEYAAANAVIVRDKRINAQVIFANMAAAEEFSAICRRDGVPVTWLGRMTPGFTVTFAVAGMERG